MNGCVAHRSIGNGQMVVEALVIVAHNSTSITSKKFAKASHCAEILFLPFLFLFFFFFFLVVFFLLLKLSMLAGSQVDIIYQLRFSASDQQTLPAKCQCFLFLAR